MKLKNDAVVSRRQFVNGMTAGLAVAFVSPAALGQQGRPQGQPGQQASGPVGSLQGPSQSRKQAALRQDDPRPPSSSSASVAPSAESAISIGGTKGPSCQRHH